MKENLAQLLDSFGVARVLELMSETRDDSTPQIVNDTLAQLTSVLGNNRVMYLMAEIVNTKAKRILTQSELGSVKNGPYYPD